MAKRKVLVYEFMNNVRCVKPKNGFLTLAARQNQNRILGFNPGSCKPWNDITTNNDMTTNNELSNYSIELSVQTGVSTRPL